MSSPRIKDIPTIKQLLDQARGLEQLARVFPVFRPFLKLLGVRVDEMEAALAQAKSLSKAANELATLPDRFNSLFAARGWIIYETMNLDVARAAISAAEAGGLDSAEEVLASYYNAETVNWNLTLMNGVKAFRPRMDLARKALIDYTDGRYHASVPLTLALLDGLVNELGPRGFFAEGVNLKAWDSVAAHSTGLQQLAKILGAGRFKTTTERITVPYRHGILHGLDLGFDNKTVAAKAWAALFAARDWALKVERGQRSEPLQEPRPSWRKLFRQLQQNGEEKARLETWGPRMLTPGREIPVSGQPEAYGEGSPERRLAEFLGSWRMRNYGRMADCLPHYAFERGQSFNKVAGELRAYYDAMRLQDFEFQAVDDEAAALTVITTKLISELREDQREQVVHFRMIFEDQEGNPRVRGQDAGTWTVFNHWV